VIDGQSPLYEETVEADREDIHRIVNSGDTRMVLVAALSMAPVQVRHADDQPMPLPWQSRQIAGICGSN
jgi:hypothetical protein